MDGACEPNPGKMAWGAALYRLGVPRTPLELVGYTSGLLDGQGTNNEAELRAMGEGLTWATMQLVVDPQVEGTLRAVYSDSQLAVNILSGKWLCRAHHLKPVVRDVLQALAVAGGDVGIAVGWLPRQRTGIAHHLSRQELRPLRVASVEEMAPPEGDFR